MQLQKERFQPTLDAPLPSDTQKKEIQRLYWPVFVATALIEIALLTALRVYTLKTIPANVYYMGLWAIAHFVASRVCRIAGKSFESRTTETLVREVESVWVREPYFYKTSNALWTFFCVLSAIGTIVFPLIAIFGGSAPLPFVLSALLSLFLLVFSFKRSKPKDVVRQSITSDGISANGKRVPWEKIHNAEIVTQRNAFGEVASVVVRLRGSNGKALAAHSLAIATEREAFLDTLRAALKGS